MSDLTVTPSLPSASLKQLHELLNIDALTNIIDIGANPIEGAPPYKDLLTAGLCNVVGCEPQSESFAHLSAQNSLHEKYLPYAVGDGSAVQFNICRHSGWSSTLRPNALSLQVFTQYESNASIVDTKRIETRRLDDITEIDRIDFLKIDIQGGELAVFKNATNRLSNTVFIHSEVSFVNLYDDQPSFGEIDIELRRQGFIPHRFGTVKKGIIPPFLLNGDPWQTTNQLLDGDVVYVRDFRDLKPLDDNQLKHMSLIAHACYGSWDLAYRCVTDLERRKAIAAGGARRYLELVNQILAGTMA